VTRTSFKDRDCPIALGSDAIGDKWKILILRNLFFGAGRYDYLLEHLNISSKVLSSRLAEMVNDGILTKRTPESDKRARLYSLTDKGRELLPMLIILAQWNDRWAGTESVRILSKNNNLPIENVTLRSTSGEQQQLEDIIITEGRSRCSDLLSIRKIVRNRESLSNNI
jgi:DNA-binding HxlR family transcriptional regulator